MIRVHRCGVVAPVAGDALLRRALINPVQMALTAVSVAVGTRKGKSCYCIVIEIGSHPLNFVMTCRAILGKSTCLMIGIHCCGVVAPVAGDTLQRCSLVNPILMTAGADRSCMPPCQWKLSINRVIELSSGPAKWRMAHRTVFRDARISMVRVPGVFVFRGMAGKAILGCSLIDVVYVTLHA
jgi:hypothetical protein